MTGLAQTRRSDPRWLYLGQGSHPAMVNRVLAGPGLVLSVCPPRWEQFVFQGCRGLVPGPRLSWKSSRLSPLPSCLQHQTVWAHLTPSLPPSLACCWPALFPLPFESQISAWREKRFCVLEGLTSLLIHDQTLMLRWVQSLPPSAKYTHKIPA